MSRSRDGTWLTTRSPIFSTPREMSSRPATMRSAVVLPQPDGPTSTMNSPSSIPRLREFTAVVPSGYVFVTPSNVTPAIGGSRVDSGVLTGARRSPPERTRKRRARCRHCRARRELDPVRVPESRFLHGHRFRVRPGRIWTRERGLALALLAVVGPGVLAGLSDDDPAGITTYSILGADFGYRLLWTLLASTAALVLFHDLTVRLGIATGKGLVSVIRMRYGVKAGGSSAGFLVVANLGTTAAEMAGIAAGLEIGGVSRYVSVPLAAAAVATLVLVGSVHRVEFVLLAISSVFITYIASGILAHPKWGDAARGLVVPHLPFQRHAILVAAATLGTTLAPWGLAFIQSYAVDKKLKPSDWKFERIDVVVGAVATGVIGLFVVIACAETLHRTHPHIDDASDAAVALTPLAGHLASTLFAVGLVGAGLLAAAILPLSTSYSVSEAFGKGGGVGGK